MKLKENSVKDICNYVLQQLQKEVNVKLTTEEIRVFQSYSTNLDYDKVAKELDIKPIQAIRINDNIFRKLKIKDCHIKFESKDDFLKAPLFLHGLSSRLYNCLRSRDYINLNEVVKTQAIDLKRIRGFGKKAFKELYMCLSCSVWQIYGVGKEHIRWQDKMLSHLKFTKYYPDEQNTDYACYRRDFEDPLMKNIHLIVDEKISCYCTALIQNNPNKYGKDVMLFSIDATHDNLILAVNYCKGLSPLDCKK